MPGDRGFLAPLILLAACAADDLGSETTVCEQAAELIAECTGSPAEAVAECQGDAKEFSQGVVAAGCEGLGGEKADGWTQLCQPHLKRWFGLWPSFCDPEPIVCEPSQADLDPSSCNGSPALCERRYDQVVYATSHNAFNVARLEFFRPNQSYRMFRQLKDGVRALMLDTHDSKAGDQVLLCHDDCKNGAQSLVEGLGEIRTFLDCYPREVVTLLIQPEVGDPKSQVAAFRATGLDELAYVHAPGEPWPTLGELLDQGKRIVVLAEVLADDMPDWYSFMWDHAFDNDFRAERTSDFGCELERGVPDNALFGLNHFLTLDIFGKGIGGDAWASIAANKYDSLMGHIDECTAHYGKTPNFVSVDFYDSGAVLEVVDELNRLGPTQP
ncbi:MAG: hypothetical protein KJO07_17535 [Deltaproteobacteria bacterium]|nr:hypothetical protein [Deltaproteobacteria bacterium]